MKIYMGALADALETQLDKQGLRFKDDALGMACQGYHDAIVRLAICGILTHTEKERAQKRLMKKIPDGVEPTP